MIPVKRQITGIPALTIKVKHNKAYLAEVVFYNICFFEVLFTL